MPPLPPRAPFSLPGPRSGKSRLIPIFRHCRTEKSAPETFFLETEQTGDYRVTTTLFGGIRVRVGLCRRTRVFIFVPFSLFRLFGHLGPRGKSCATPPRIINVTKRLNRYEARESVSGPGAAGRTMSNRKVYSSSNNNSASLSIMTFTLFQDEGRERLPGSRPGLLSIRSGQKAR